MQNGPTPSTPSATRRIAQQAQRTVSELRDRAARCREQPLFDGIASGKTQQSGVVPGQFAPDVEPGLAAAYEHCRQVNKHYGKTYYFSTCFFPAHLRPAVHALYAWVRYPDEWVDNPGGLPLAVQREKLAGWRDATRDALAAGTSPHPVLAAWADAALTHAVPLDYMLDFIAAMEQDLTVTEYPTFEDLKGYTWGSASVVGLMMCHLVGAKEAAAVPHATSLGLAMQLTNFLRDVGEDWRQRGRVYLPLGDLERFGVRKEDVAAGRVTDNICALLQFEIERTRAIYEHADKGMEYLPHDARLPVRLARVLYARILDKIEQNGCDVFSRRARVPTWEKLLVLAREQRAHSGKTD
jgi:phytoene synthase